jgi:hypothetical protein
LIEQPVGVVERGSQHLAAGDILEDCGDPPPDVHARGIERLGCAEARAGGAEGANQKDGLDQVTPRLLDGECREPTVIQRSLAHDAVDRERELLGDLLERHGGNGTVAAPRIRQQCVGILDGALAALDRDIHGSALLQNMPRSTGVGAYHVHRARQRRDGIR